MNNIILTGFMGCGKTSIGIRLSYGMKCVMIDTDKQIELEQKKSISEIFAESGESAFRDMETAYLRKLLDEKGSYILSTGGGLPMREENHTLLHRLGTVFYLRANPETIYARLQNDTTRPLLQGENPKQKIEELMAVRAPIYEKAADVIIDVDDKEYEEILSEIMNRIPVSGCDREAFYRREKTENEYFSN